MVKLNDKQSHSHRQKNGARGPFDIEQLIKNKKKGGGNNETNIRTGGQPRLRSYKNLSYGIL